jgi:hypothetical protein
LDADLKGAAARLEGLGGPVAQEVRRMVNGRPAIFNAATKEFIRWE